MYHGPYRLKSNNEGWLTSYADLITNLLIFFVLIISASAIQSGKMEKIIQSISENSTPQNLTKASQEVAEELKKLNLEKDARVEMTDSGLEIIFDSGVTFDSGSASILEAMQDPLSKILSVITPYSTRYQFAVEGHTDARPIISGTYKSNWELSSARAMTIRERMEAVGIPGQKIRVEAYAANKPLPGTLKGQWDDETFLAKHRRVVIRLF